jgi:hypothetical protein
VAKTATYEVSFSPGRGFRGNPWRIRIRLADIRGRWECIGVSLESEPNKPAPVTTSTLRKLPLGRLIQAARVEADGKRWGRKAVAAYESDLTEIPLGASPEFTAALRGETPGRSRLNLEHFVKVANTYQTAYRKGRNPTMAVAKRFTVSKSTAAKWVHRCRVEFGLLPKTSRGKPVGISRRTES